MASSEKASSGRGVYLRRTWRGSCPQCGQASLFEGYARMRRSCRICELVFRRESGAMTGSMYLSAAVTEVFAAFLAVTIFLVTDWAVLPSLALALPIFFLFSFWFLPRAMGIWAAIEYMVDESNGEPWVHPRL